MANSYASRSSKSDEVYLSYRGPDTGSGFTDYLYHKLTDAGIPVFRDDDGLPDEKIDGLLEQVIDTCKIYIPIFSQSYASSRYCLRGLRRLMENTLKSEGNKELLPIFFDVEPGDVRLETSLYRDAIFNLEHEEKSNKEQIDAWKRALTMVDPTKGWEVKNHRGQGQVIKLVVEEVVKKLRIKHKKVTQHLVGIDYQVEELRELLDLTSGNVRLIKVHGMGGIGKTTIAKIVFNELSRQFGIYCCFLEDVRERSSMYGLVDLQKELLREMGVHAGTESIDEIQYGMKRIGEALHNKKVLIILDDVDNSKQVEKLVGKSILFSGSRVLITTRNQDVLRNYRTKYQVLPYEVEVMSINHALQLFSRHAFKSDFPSEDYSSISSEIVSACGGLPLTLGVNGSLLYGKPKAHWAATLEKMKHVLNRKVYGHMKISFDYLTYEQKQIFLDIACFFIGEDKTNAIYMWEDCGFLGNDGVDVLNSMSMIKITENNTFWMQDQFRDFGRTIVRENSIDPGGCSRLWHHEQILEAIRTKKLKNEVQALNLDIGKSHHDVVINSAEIERFERLAYLKLTGGTFVGDLGNCLTNLKWLSWSRPSQTSKPNNMHLRNVVVLQFSNNDFIDDVNLRSLTENASKLKVLSLESCHSITKTPNFSGCPNLERLTLEDCSKLREIDSSIGDLVNLKHFSIQRSNVKKLPSMCKLKLSKIHLEFKPKRGL